MLLEELIKASSETPLLGFLLVAGLALLPFLMLAFTAFIKFSVVFGILRHALGTGNIPSSSVITLVSLLLSLHVASPILAKMELEQIPTGKNLESETKMVLAGLKGLEQPLREFLIEHSREKELVYFEGRNSSFSKDSFANLVPAFILSELREAFAIGFVLFLPFLIIDLLVANVLVGMGIMMLSPMSIALPVKIITFVVFDGWFRLSESLLFAYSL